jgi:hypothetical protein
MVRELQLLTVGLVFAFLGAIVMGVFCQEVMTQGD